MNITEEEISRASSLVEIEELVSKCERCLLYQTKIKDVAGAGSKTAEIMFIGEAPGKKEDDTGEPFIGASGKLLNEMLQSIGLRREDTFITSVLKHRPPSNRDPLSTEIQACCPYLNRQIELINPRLVVFLGRHAMNMYFPKLKISEVHGEAFQAKLGERKQDFLALYHPAAALYNGSMKSTLVADFNKIPAILAKIMDSTSSPQESKI